MVAAALAQTWSWDVSPGTALVAFGGAALYVASRAGADALAGGDPDRPGWRALGHCLPIAVVALLCLRPSMARPDLDAGGIGRPGVAVALLFSTSMACLTLVLGIVTYLAPVTALPPSRRVWPFVLPVALLSLVAGLNGRLTWVHAAMLVLLGLTILNLWWGSEAVEMSTQDERVTREAKIPPSRLLQGALAIALAAVGGWAMTRGAARLEQTSRVLSGVLLAGTVLSPLLILPVLGTGARQAERGRPDSAVTTLVAMALINLCAVLPMVIVAHYAMVALAPPVATAQLNAAPFQVPGGASPYPLISWRVDTVVLIVIGFGMIPWSLGRWMISRAESLALIAGYAIYVALVAILSRSWR